MGYDLADDPYIDPETGILKNKLGARTQAKLDKAEGEITYVIIATLARGSKVDGLIFNANLLYELHKEIFRDIYVWAGKPRTDDISKEWAYFAHAPYIHRQLERVFKELRNDPGLSAGQAKFVERLSYYYSELNAIHPFREGNGRTVRTLLTLLAQRYGYDIEWARMDQTENIQASKQAMRDDLSVMQGMLSGLVIKLE